MSASFKKTREDFKCGKCGLPVEGDGFTNHCTACLWSRHVDDKPGDRAMLEKCGGLMKPARVEGDTSSGVGPNEYTLIHVCENCGLAKRNKVSPRDNFDAVLNIVKGAGMV